MRIVTNVSKVSCWLAVRTLRCGDGMASASTPKLLFVLLLMMLLLMIIVQQHNISIADGGLATGRILGIFQLFCVYK